MQVSCDSQGKRAEEYIHEAQIYMHVSRNKAELAAYIQ